MSAKETSEKAVEIVKAVADSEDKVPESIVAKYDRKVQGAGASRPRVAGDLRKTGQKFEAAYPPTFKFQKAGAYIQGVVARLKTVHPGGRPALVMVLDTEKLGLVTIWPNTMLCTLLVEKGVKVGDLIGIEFKGLKQSSTDARYSYEEYELYVERE
jgi:hypothetical protein